MNEAPPSTIPGTGELFLRFTQIAVSGFGGVGPWAQRMVVEERGWLSGEEFTDMMSLCQFLPGPNIVNLAVCVGARFHGVRGALAAFAGLMAAPFAIILGLGVLYTQYGDLPAVSSAFRRTACREIGRAHV